MGSDPQGLTPTLRNPLLRRQPRASRGHRRADARLHDAARHHHRGGGRLHRQLQAGRSGPLPGGRDARAADRRQVSRAQPGQEHRRPQGARGRQRQGRGGAGEDGGPLRPRRGAGLHGPRAGQRRGKRAPPPVAPGGRRLPGGDGPGHLGGCENLRGPRQPPRPRRFLRDLARAGQQLQRPRARHPRRHALRVPRHGERADPHERRLPEAHRRSSSPSGRC